MEESQEQTNSRPWLYKKGQSGNPGGRPVGSKSMKTWIKEKFAMMTEDERENFLEGLNKDVIWKMGEGNPESTTDITSNGEGLTPILVKFIDSDNGKNNTDTSRVQKPL